MSAPQVATLLAFPEPETRKSTLLIHKSAHCSQRCIPLIIMMSQSNHHLQDQRLVHQTNLYFSDLWGVS